MTYTVEVVIWCDWYEGCDEHLVYSARNKGGLTKTSAALYARLIAGWHIPGKDPKKALCPKHSPKEA